MQFPLLIIVIKLSISMSDRYSLFYFLTCNEVCFWQSACNDVELYINYATSVNGVARIFFWGGQPGTFSVISPGSRPHSVGGGGSSRNFP